MQDIAQNLPKSINVKPEVAVAFVIGSLVGGTGMTLIAIHEQRKYAKLVEKQTARQHARFQYVMQNIQEHVPTETLTKIITYMEADLIASYEDGVEIGMDPEGEEPTPS